MGIGDWPAGEGPRDKLLERGADALSDAELLAVLLQTGYRGCSALDLARSLLVQYAGLDGVMRAQRSSLLACRRWPCQVRPVAGGPGACPTPGPAGTDCGDVLSSPDKTRRFLQYHLGGHTREVFSCLFLDSQHRVLRCEDLFLGTLDGAAVYPREVAVRALQYNAAAVIFAHNHPSGVAEPSAADRRITERLCAALSLLDIRVLDHIIVGRGREYSFAEQGLL